MVSKAAQELGALGGRSTSPAKAAAARANGSRPKGKWVTALYYTAQKTDGTTLTGLVMCKGNLTEAQERAKALEHALVVYLTRECEIHAICWESCRIKI